MADRRVEVQRLLSVFKCRTRPLPLAHPAQSTVGAGLAGLVPELAVQLEGLLAMLRSLLSFSELGPVPPEALVGAGLPLSLPQAHGGSQRSVLSRGIVVPVPAPVEERLQHPGQLPCV